ncbi:MAG: MBL fold metallo-hydrolase [Candidatus Limnocylindrales bacterium]
MADLSSPAIEPVVILAQMPAGVVGPEPETLEVRSFVIACTDGIVLVDVGLPGTLEAMGSALDRIGARWSDVTDVVLTHSHFDHVGGLAEAATSAPQAALWAGRLDVPAIRLDGRVVRPLSEGDRVRDLVVLDSPGHTPGHISLLHEAASLVLVGDLVGSIDGTLTLGPPAFTADPERSRASLARMVDLGVDRLVFSHGAEVTDPNQAVRDLLDASR